LNGARTHRDRFDDVGSAPDAAIDDDLAPVADGLCERCDRRPTHQLSSPRRW
jgi:hypothetical protein